MSRHTPLHAAHRELGATFTEFAGWSMPVRYSSEIAEHHAVRTSAGLFDLCHMGELEVTGPAAGPALDYALVGWPSKLGVGRARYSMMCDESGGILDDVVVYRLSEERFLIVANASNTQVVLSQLRERISGFGATVKDARDDWALLAVQGPTSAAILGEVTDLDVSGLKYYTVDAGQVVGRSALLARTGYTGEDGFEVYLRPEDAAAVWSALLARGQVGGIVPAGLACRDTLRLEAGMPLYGQELTAALTPFDAGLGRVVAFDKPGGFVGDTALARRRDAGSASTLVGLVSSGRRSPRTGYTVIEPQTASAIGEVTSGAPSPTLGHPIAMAYVASNFAEPGTKLAVDIRGVLEAAEVVPLPFYRRAN